jgi:hypothetical protein
MKSTAPLLALVGGFLGAGKTTLVLAAARRLSARGVRVAFVTNDQGDDLIDTAMARAADVPVEEVTGGCFCCRLSDLLRATDALASARPDVIFAEPVGSCIDLSATIVHPLLADHPGRFHIAPLTVLVDPGRALSLRAASDEADLAYLFRRQIEEADIVCYTKSDLGMAGPALPDHVALSLSAHTGAGIDAWLDRVCDVHALAGARFLDVDYERYAAAEAALGWLNWQVRIELATPLSPLQVVGPIVERLDEGLTAAGAPIVHVKVLDQTATGHVRVSLCANGVEPTVDGRLDASPTRSHQVLVNARAHTDPRTLASVVDASLAPLASGIVSSRGSAFAPSPPKPERRITRGSR